MLGPYIWIHWSWRSLNLMSMKVWEPWQALVTCMPPLSPTQNPFQFASPPLALWTLFLWPTPSPFPPCCTITVLNSSWSAVNNAPPTLLTKPPPVWSRQGRLREQLHHGGQQVCCPEHGGGGGGLHVQVPHHPLCLHHTRAAQPREPGEMRVTLSVHLPSLCSPDSLTSQHWTVYFDAHAFALLLD